MERRVEDTRYEENPELLRRQLEIFTADLSQLLQRQHERTRELWEAHTNFAMAFALFVEAHDPDTRDHLDRTRLWARRIAVRMDIPNSEELELGFLLHDIGKCFVPKEILLAPRSLTEAEWKIMRSHPVAGAHILSGVIPERALDVIRSHHERWDGTGYPRGLKGEEIPIGARVFAVTDVFDALTSLRPYRAELSFAEALDFLGKDGGAHFDPEVLGVFLEVFSEVADPGDAGPPS